MARLLRGTVSGLLATVLMTGIIALGRALGLLQEPPPREITRNAEADAGASPHQQPRGLFDLSWLAAHFGFGAGCGALYGLLGRLIPGGSLLSGTLYGLLVWAVNYLGVLPALQLYPSLSEDRDSRSAVMVAAHIGYGAVLGKLAGRK